MILIVSDLHFADTAARRTVDATLLCALFAKEAKTAMEMKEGRLTILLLGDIFEVLKSQLWIDRAIRPWDADGAQHTKTVTDIFNRIVDANKGFFDGVTALKKRYGAQIEFVYVPGNHDWPLNSVNVGAHARQRLVQLLTLDHPDPMQPFSESYVNADYGLIASHGHEHDPLNRTTPAKIALGDAIVIEVLLRLPELVAQGLGWSSIDPRLEFLHELDNVRPQSPRVLAAWLNHHTGRLKDPKARGAVESALNDIPTRLAGLRDSRKVTRAWREGSLWIDFWAAALSTKKATFLASHVGVENDSGNSYAHHAVKDLRALVGSSYDFGPQLVVHGHTHIPELVPLSPVKQLVGPAPVYLNTGTWRRMHCFAPGTKGAPVFADYLEHTHVIVYNGDEQTFGKPRYELQRAAHG